MYAVRDNYIYRQFSVLIKSYPKTLLVYSIFDILVIIIKDCQKSIKSLYLKMHHFIHGSVKIRLCFPTVLPVQIDITINLFFNNNIVLFKSKIEKYPRENYMFKLVNTIFTLKCSDSFASMTLTPRPLANS